MNIPDSPSLVSKFYNQFVSITDKMNTSLNKVRNPIQDNLGTWKTNLNKATSNLYSIMQFPEDIKTTFNSLLSDYANITSLPQEMEDAWLDLIDLGNDNGYPDIIDNYNFKVNDRIQEAQNDYSLNEIFRLSALSNLYEAAAYKDQYTDVDLLQTKDYLEDKFQYQVNNIYEYIDQLGIESAIDDSRNDLYTLRNTTIQVLNEKLVNAWKIKTTNSGLTSLFLESYKEYENIDNLDILKYLNSDISWSNTKQDIKIVTL